MIAEHKHLVEKGAKLVELRLDYIRGPVAVKRLLEDRPSPVVVTCRRHRDGGKFIGSEQDRLLLLRTAIAEGADYVDLEEDIATAVPRYGQTKRIISYHDFRKTPDDLATIHQRLAGLDPDIIKIATMANRPHDSLRLLRLIREANVPTVAFGMGDVGTASRILCARYGAPLTYATFSEERTLAPGQLTYEQMVEVYRYEHINADTIVYGVVADPVGHSLSPLIHNAAMERVGLNAVYVPFRVPREDLPQFIDDCHELGVRGLSVTIPHKEEVVKKLSEADGAVRGIGACNTVVFDADQRIGFNTDYRAAMDALEEAMNIPPGAENPLLGRTALVLGAGGVGMAIVYGLTRRGANVVIADGRAAQASALAQRFKCRAVEWGSRHSVVCDLLFNGTPIGMHPEVDATPFDRHYLKPSMVVFDAVYNPENTLLIKEARERSCTVVTGVEMFVRQASLQFKHFIGQEPPPGLMREVIKRATAAVKVQ